MLAANLVNVWLRDVPDVLAHNQGDALRAFDFPAPVFQFLVGLSLALFLPAGGCPGRRTEAVRRFVTLILLGMVLDGIGALSPWPRWGVLQTLGLGGLAATALVGASTRVIVGVSLVGLALFSGVANGIVHARPDAALAFVPLTLAGYLLGRRIAAGADPARIARDASLLAVVAGLGGVGLYVVGVPFNKLIGSSSFTALTAGASSLLVAATARFEARAAAFPPGSS
jgi:predicted acyltransferase